MAPPVDGISSRTSPVRPIVADECRQRESLNDGDGIDATLHGIVFQAHLRRSSFLSPIVFRVLSAAATDDSDTLASPPQPPRDRRALPEDPELRLP